MLFVTAAPGPPANVRAEIDKEGVSIVLQWDPPTNDGDSPDTLKYYVGYLVTVSDSYEHSIPLHRDISRLLVMSSNDVTDEHPLDFSNTERAILVDATDKIEAILNVASGGNNNYQLIM